jgi:hypothetical protein
VPKGAPFSIGVCRINLSQSVFNIVFAFLFIMHTKQVRGVDAISTAARAKQLAVVGHFSFMNLPRHPARGNNAPTIGKYWRALRS